MPRAIEGISGSLLRVAEYRMIEFFRLDPGSINGALRCNGPEFLGREVFQLSAVAAKRRTGAADDGDVTWFEHLFGSDVTRTN